MNEAVLQKLANDVALRGLSSRTMDEYSKRVSFFLTWARACLINKILNEFITLFSILENDFISFLEVRYDF